MAKKCSILVEEEVKTTKPIVDDGEDVTTYGQEYDTGSFDPDRPHVNYKADGNKIINAIKRLFGRQ